MVFIGYSRREYPVALGIRHCPGCNKENHMVKKVKKVAFTFMSWPLVPLYHGKLDVCLGCGWKGKAKEFSKDLTNEFLEQIL